MKNSEQIIVAQLIKGENQAYKYIYDEYYVLLCKFAYGFLHDYYLSETIVNDAIFHIYEIRSNLSINVSLRNYLLTTVRNRCLNYLNLQHTKKEISLNGMKNSVGVHLFITSENDSPLGILIENECEEYISNAIESLPEEVSKIFKMSRYDNMTYKEISKELGLSSDTIKYHICNALRHLKESLKHFLK